MSVQWITYKGKQILYTDHRGLTGAALIQDLELSMQMTGEAAPPVLNLNNFDGVPITPEYIARARELAQERIARAKAEGTFGKGKQATVVGTKGVSAIIKKTFISAYDTMTGLNMRAFATEEEAKEWLVA